MGNENSLIKATQRNKVMGTSSSVRSNIHAAKVTLLFGETRSVLSTMS